MFEKIVFISAVGASKYANSSFLREKYECELAILNSKIPEKVILRSGIVYDGNFGTDRFIQTFAGLMSYPLFYPVPEADKTLSTVYIQDLVDICMQAATKELNKSSALLEVSEPQKYRVADLFKLVSDRFVTGHRIPVKGALAKPLLGFVEKNLKNKKNISIKDYLVFDQKQDDEALVENPLSEIMPSQWRSLEETLKK